MLSHNQNPSATLFLVMLTQSMEAVKGFPTRCQPFPAGDQLTGIAFDITGSWDTYDGDLRVQFKEYGKEENTPYVEVITTGAKNARMSNAYLWWVTYDDDDPYDYPSTPSQVEAIQFLIPTNAVDYSSFDFCVSNLRLLID